ncbi:MAG: TetR/AcrR family transcriptional regulator [Deltaproteobacteria bacterium]|nr:MAG: TetR/AcrR family transcriptional regulator [Deltaproteobacteria bacterium]
MSIAPTASSAPTHARSKGQHTAERILDVAESLFAERGYAGTTLRDVAAGVGLRIPSLYNHFPNKEALYAAVLERGLSPVLEALAALVEAGDRRRWDPHRSVATMMELLARRPDFPRLIQHETLSGGARLTDEIRAWIQPIFARARQVVQATPGAQRWKPDQIPLLVLALYQIVAGYFAMAPFHRELAGEDLLTEPALARQTEFFADLVSRLFADTPARVAAEADAERPETAATGSRTRFGLD